jgi:hypothetical protein
MGIFDIFKKKKTESAFPENELEKSLIRASSDIAARNEFYTKLLWNELVVLTNQHNESEAGRKTLEKDTNVQLVTFENGQIPVFTSTNRIFDKGVIKEEVPFMAMKGQDLFGFTKGATFILNPYSNYGKELVPQEIESLLNGSIFEKNNEMEIKENTEVLIGQPSKYPTELVKALSKLFIEEQTVNSAYLATIKMGKSEKMPHLIIAIDTEGNMSSVSGKAGALAEQIIGKNEIIDFIKIEKNNGISDYFINQIEPFYKRK